MKTMIIGINPIYNYPGEMEKWKNNNTYYASNHGASFITRSLIKEFDADYIDDFSDIKTLKNKYDTCIFSLATHAHAKRNIWHYVNLVEKLDMKTVVISLGVEDYIGEINSPYKLHPSVLRLLEIASASTEWIGVRGHYTASIIQQNGFRNVVPIGCPSIFSTLKPTFNINIKTSYKNPLVVYHKTLAKNNLNLIKNYDLLGQDFQDEAIFTNNLVGDIKLLKMEENFYNNLKNKDEIIELIQKNGIFTRNYNEWINIIKKHDFVFGPRLHGCLAALTMGIPAVLTPRDLRVKEIVEFFDLPNIPYEKLKNSKINDLIKKADFEKFYKTYKLRYKNYLSFITENKLNSQLEKIENINFSLSSKDIQSINYINNIQLAQLKKSITQKTKRKYIFKLNFYKKILKKLKNKKF